MNIRKLLVVILILEVLNILFLISSNANVDVSNLSLKETNLQATKIGIGGGGALFEPAISPFDSNEMLTVPDMGGLYISHNKGDQWDRVNMYGTTFCACYDPNREGIIYAGGSGVWRSTDYGKTFEMIFPKQDDLIKRLIHRGNAIQQLFTESGIYDRSKMVKNILVDPDDSNHIFVLSYYNKDGKVYESVDNGENFKVLFTYSKSTRHADHFDLNELMYKKETRELFVINKDEILGYNLDNGELKSIVKSQLGFIDESVVYENGKTYFIIIEKTDKRDDSNTVIYYTNDFNEKVDLTDVITSVKPTYFDHNTYGHVTYKYDFNYVSATTLENIYVTNKSNQETSSLKEYPYTIDGIIHYKNGEAKYLYGNPFYDHNHLASRSWNDGCTYALGIYASKLNDDEFLFTTLNGVNYSADNINIYPKHTTLVEGKYPNATFVTNGIDEQRTYGVVEDPFHEGHMLLLNTDLGLIRTEDNEKSWEWIRKGIPNNWSNTIYDAIYDEKKENVVYSVWSGRHNAPLNAANETDNRYGGFAISTDGGKTWNSNYSSGLPENTIPVKMNVIYNDNQDDVTIYLATYNCGFYISNDSGKTFIEMNNGIEKIKYKEDEKYHYIFAQDIEVKDGHIYGLTAKTSYNNESQYGSLYEYIDGSWNKIELPKRVYEPTDIYYFDNTLYISTSCEPIWDGKNGTAFNNYTGGVYAYKNGEFTQIFDESIYTTSTVFDSKGTMYIGDMSGNIYRKEKEGEFELIYKDYHYKSESIQITDDGDRIYLSTNGGGVLKLEGLNSLYKTDILGDINSDGKITINDLVLLKLHLIEKDMLSGQSLKNADIDGDNNITINDLAKMKKLLLSM